MRVTHELYDAFRKTRNQLGSSSFCGPNLSAEKAPYLCIRPLGDRPFGDVNTIGLNGILFFVIEARGHREHRFLDITQFNIARWQGKKEFIATFRTGIPPDGAPPPVQNLHYRIWRGGPGGQVELHWDVPPDADVASCNVYRVLAPQYHSVSFQARYEKVATVDGKTTHVEVQPPPGYAGVTDVTCFMVTAVDSKGRESGYARDRELTRFAYPGGGASVERQGPGGRTALVTLNSNASLHLRESALIERGTRLAFRFRTTNQAPVALRLWVAGLGDVQIVLVGPPLPNDPVLWRGDHLNDGDWKYIDLELRPLLDKVAAERDMSPAEARTTWNDDWLVTEWFLGNFHGSSAPVSTNCEFEDVRVFQAGTRRSGQSADRR